MKQEEHTPKPGAKWEINCESPEDSMFDTLVVTFPCRWTSFALMWLVMR